MKKKVSSHSLGYLQYYLNQMLYQKRFSETDNGFVELSERICLEQLNGLDGFDLFRLNISAHSVYDAFRYQKDSSAQIRDQEEFLVEDLHTKLSECAEIYPEFESLSRLFDNKIDANIRVLLTDPSFSKTMTSISRSIKGKISTVLENLSKNKDNYEEPASKEVTEVCKMLLDLDTQNYERKDQESIDKAIEKTKKEVTELIGPYSDKKYSINSYETLKCIIMDYTGAMYGKDYFETPDTWNKHRVVRW